VKTIDGSVFSGTKLTIAVEMENPHFRAGGNFSFTGDSMIWLRE
jgi:hypothetical protein